MNLCEPITHLCGFCESPLGCIAIRPYSLASHDMAGDRDNLSQTAQICAENHNNLLNLCESIVRFCGSCERYA